MVKGDHINQKAVYTENYYPQGSYLSIWPIIKIPNSCYEQTPSKYNMDRQEMKDVKEESQKRRDNPAVNIRSMETPTLEWKQ